MSSGWIKLHRKVLEDATAMKDKDHFMIWMYLLLNATHSNYKSFFKGEQIILAPGQLITGRKVLSEKLDIEESKVTRILKLFEKDGKIIQVSSNKNRLITIIKWSEYQQVAEQQNNGCSPVIDNSPVVQSEESEQQVNNKTPKSEQQTTENDNESEQQENGDKVDSEQSMAVQKNGNEQQMNNRPCKSEQQNTPKVNTYKNDYNKNDYKNDDDDYIGYVDKYNSITKKDFEPSSSSKDKFELIKSEYGMTKLYKALDEVNTSEYLKVNMSLDWLLQVNNFIKVLNGNYRKFKVFKTETPKRKTGFHNFESRTEKYSAEQLDDVVERIRAERTGKN